MPLMGVQMHMRKRWKRNGNSFEKSGRSRHGRWPEALEPRTVLSSGYFQLSLASNLAASALVQDPNLVGPWGMTANPSGGDLWVVDGGSALATHYSGAAGTTASPFQENSSTIGNIGSQPRGDAFNGSSNFVVHSGAASGPATLLFDSEDGKISGWNTSVPPPSPSPSAQTAATTSGAIYTGIALENDNSRHLIYAADFHDARVDVFDSGFNRVTLAGGFSDPNLPAGYAPYNILNTGTELLVSFAQQDASKQNAVAGASLGIVDAFNYDGQLLNTLIPGGPSHPTSKLNAPWGMAIAPAGFGDFSGELLVANTGDGEINAFDPTTGAYQGTLSSPGGNPLVANGLHGLSFGNGSAGNSNTLFYTAAGSGGQQGVLGEIISAQNSQFPAVGPVLSVAARDTFDGVVAVFNDIHSDPLNSFSAYIDWGDNSPGSAGTFVALPSGGFGVVSSHVYSTVGQYSLSVRIQDSQFSIVTATGSVSVTPPRLLFAPTTPVATEGLQFSGAVTTFTDQDNNGSPSFYQATIDWGDGTVTAGTVSVNGSFTVSGTHTYASQGSEPITITVTDVDGSTGTAHVTASVVSSMTGSPVPIQTSEATDFSGTVATFTDANTNRLLTDYSATINWGDGTITTGIILPDGSGGFSVTGTHSYGDEGTENVSVAISDPGSTITVASTAQISDLDTLSATASPVSGSEAAAFSGAVATFSDTLPNTPASDFAATIDWGDGTVTAGAVTATAGIFTISGSHTYLDEGSFTVKSSVQDVGGTASASVQSTASIADADALTATAVSVNAVAGQTFTAAVATFDDVNLAALAGDFAATINWGDSVTTAGVVSGSNGKYTVTGTHAYATEGSDTATVAIADDAPGTATASATATITVSGPPPVVSPTPFGGAEQSALSVEVATFTQPGSSVGAGSYTATIAWGDGATSTGSVTTTNGGFAVSGKHTYADEGQYHFSVTVSRTGGASATAAGIATIVEPQLSDGTNGTPNSRWINELYNDLLHRPAEVAALTFLSGQLTAGVGRGQIVAGIEASAEFRGDEVQTVYETYLHRAAESAAQSFGVQYLAGHSVEQLSAIVIGSTEYFQNRGGGTDDGFLDALFGDVLHRPVDSGARQYFDGLLKSGTSTAQVAADIFASSEYLDDLVNSLYIELLDRPADSGGLGYFVGQLQQGSSDSQVIAELASSGEYFAKTSENGA